MKVTSDNTLNSNAKVDESSAGNDADSMAATYGLTLDGTAEKSDFETVLDRVTRSRDNGPETKRNEQRSDEPSASRENKTRRQDEVQPKEALAVSDRPVTPQPAIIVDSNTDARAILHTADLERIVAICRAQITVTGPREVTLDLTHSVLDGLRAKVSADAAGRITTEFLTTNEGVKSLLDTRAPELIALMRARGVDLHEFKSSVAADSNGRNDSREKRDSQTRAAGAIESVAATIYRA
jgi:hypothetical protein